MTSFTRVAVKRDLSSLPSWSIFQKMSDCVDNGDTKMEEPSTDVGIPFNLKPQDGAECCVLLVSSDQISMKYPLDKEIDFVIGDNDSCIDESISDVLLTMKAGEEKTIKLQPASDLPGENVVASDCLTLTITLCSFKNSQPIFLQTNEQKFKHASEHKSKGVELFKAKNIKYAFMQFSKAMKYLISMLPVHSESETFQAQYNILRVQCYSNLAACQLTQKSYTFVISNCTKALTIDSNHVKCLYRRAEANFQLGKYDLCSKDVKEGLKYEPKSKSFLDLMRKVTGQAN